MVAHLEALFVDPKLLHEFEASCMAGVKNRRDSRNANASRKTMYSGNSVLDYIRFHTRLWVRSTGQVQTTVHTVQRFLCCTVAQGPLLGSADELSCESKTSSPFRLE